MGSSPMTFDVNLSSFFFKHTYDAYLVLCAHLALGKFAKEAVTYSDLR